MFARWGSFWIGVWLFMAPLVLGYQSLATILHDVAIGLLVSVASLAAFQWPMTRFTLVLPGLWLLTGSQLISAGDRSAQAAQLASGIALIGLSLVPSARLITAPPAKIPV